MKKLATGIDVVYCSLSFQEFKALAKLGQGQVPDNTDVDIAWVKTIADFATTNKVLLTEVANKASQLITSINAIP